MKVETTTVLAHATYGGDYRCLELEAPGIAPEVRPGQFVHIRLPAPADAILRRPFSVFRADGDRLQILYKAVGRGTAAMRHLQPGDGLSILGPLGNGFPAAAADALPVLVAGGYGMAALYLQARTLPRRGIAFFGGAKAGDILCVPEFEALGWEVRATTQDGSRGERGLVTDALDAWLSGGGRDLRPEFFACGPNGMLRAVGGRAEAGGWTAWLSMDRHMGCGVGACLTCVQKIRDPDAPGGWSWVRICREGPVMECRTVVWEGDE
ncbi:MAG: dihydroorotate dehydrogenase electron transfer subunit [Lentisphaerae bacterium]|nr:dihydroorotate dehydrogenase electron transfer subunit [Lentisphaerota bacterium]